VQLGSTDAEIYLLCGLAIMNRYTGRREVPAEELARARALFAKSTQLDPAMARAWAGLGATYTFDPDPTAGIAALEKSLALAPADEEAAFYLVQLYARTGRRAEAQKLVDTVIAPAGNRQLLGHAREALLAAEIEEVRTLANARKYKEAIALAKSVMSRTSNPALVTHLAGMVEQMEQFEARRKP
jgi:tetratricopeptide (TPR) repeat protein